jgi:hypothetical protein
MKIIKEIKEHIILVKENYILIVLIAGAMLYAYHRHNYVKQKGVITIAKVTNWSASGDGSNLYLDIYWKKSIIKGVVDEYLKGKLDKYYFVKVDKDNPGKYIQFLDIEVPTCFINEIQTKLPDEGWLNLPLIDCK